MMGLLIGSFLSGYLSDIYGRKYGLLGCILVSSTGSLVGSFMPDYWSYLAVRVVTAIGAVGLFNSTFTMTIELMGSKEVSGTFQNINFMKLIKYSDCSLVAMVNLQEPTGKHNSNAICNRRDNTWHICHLHQGLCHTSMGHVCCLLYSNPFMVHST